MLRVCRLQAHGQARTARTMCERGSAIEHSRVLTLQLEDLRLSRRSACGEQATSACLGCAGHGLHGRLHGRLPRPGCCGDAGNGHCKCCSMWPSGLQCFCYFLVDINAARTCKSWLSTVTRLATMLGQLGTRAAVGELFGSPCLVPTRKGAETTNPPTLNPKP